MKTFTSVQILMILLFVSVAEASSVAIHQTDFTDGFPAGWSIDDGDGDDHTWTSENPEGRSNPNWTGTFMIVDSAAAGEIDMDEDLTTPSLDCSQYANIMLRFKHFFQSDEDGICDVDVRVSRGQWENVARFEEDSASGLVSLDISSIAAGQTDVQIRWHYYDTENDEYWGIDDVTILGTGSSDEIPRYLSGYFKWLLHLGANPEDHLGYYPSGPSELAYLSGQEELEPFPGLICDFSNLLPLPLKGKVSIWTPQYDAEGIFGDEATEQNRSQTYHVYINCPQERAARFRLKYFGWVKIWNNDELVVEKEGFAKFSEQFEDFQLHRGTNSITLQLRNGYEPDGMLAVRITDRQNSEYNDLTFLLTPPLPEGRSFVRRTIPDSYDGTEPFDVTLHVSIDPDSKPEKLTIIEYIPDGLLVADPGPGHIIGRSIQWSLSGPDVTDTDLVYSLQATPDATDRVAFCGYFHAAQGLEDILGRNIIYDPFPGKAQDMAGRITTIEIDAENYTASENAAIGHLDPNPRHLVTGLRADPAGGWAEYEFAIEQPGDYSIILDYGEHWTMYHHAAEATVTVDNTTNLHAYLYPTTHSHVGGRITVERPWEDPQRKAFWHTGIVHLNAGEHVLRLAFPAMYPPGFELNIKTDGRPVIKEILVTNYPGLYLPNEADPHHLDSYEHGPACIVQNREINQLPDGRVELILGATFFSLSQGREVYSVTGHVRPRVGQNNARFEIVAMEPDVFYLAENDQQDFALTVRSTEPVPDDYSELVEVWLRGAPAAPSRKLHLFSTAQTYLTLPGFYERNWPENDAVFSWIADPDYIKHDITEPAEIFIPSREDLGLDAGRYDRNMIQFFKDQFSEGNLPTISRIFQDNEWTYDNHSFFSWERIWADIFGAFYGRDTTSQPKAYVQRLADNLPFYPIEARWDDKLPLKLPGIPRLYPKGVSVLATHVKTVQEGMIDDQEQFKVLHSMVLPFFQSFYDGLRVQMSLAEDVRAGDRELPILRPDYGATGCPADGLPPFWDVRVGDDLYQLRWRVNANTLGLQEPLRKDYPKGTRIIPWNFTEQLELEALDVMSLLAIGAAARDPAVIDEIMWIFSEFLDKGNIFLEDGSFRNEPGSYGDVSYRYPKAVLQAKSLFGENALNGLSEEVLERMHKFLIHACAFAFSNGLHPQLNRGGSLNQMGRTYGGPQGLLLMLEQLFPEDQDNLAFYQHLFSQEQARRPGDILENANHVFPGYGYAMLRAADAPWDNRMETLLSSKHLLSDPGDHVSHDCLGIVVYGLGTILTPRYGYSWIGYLPPFHNQVMVDGSRENGYYGSFWHFDGRAELPSAVAHTGDGLDSTLLDFRHSRWDIQFPEYLFDVYFIDANDGQIHQYDWCFMNMGDLIVWEPEGLAWQPYGAFLEDYWQTNQGGGSRSIAAIASGRATASGRIVADWAVSNQPWVPNGDPTVLRNPPQHTGRLRLIMADHGPGNLIDAQIGYFSSSAGRAQANSQDILVVRKHAVSHAFVATLEPVVVGFRGSGNHLLNVEVVEIGQHGQRLTKVTTIQGEDWIYVSGNWGARPDGNWPVAGLYTDGDIVVWRVVSGQVTKFYIANGSFAETPHGSWHLSVVGNHYKNGDM